MFLREKNYQLRFFVAFFVFLHLPAAAFAKTLAVVSTPSVLYVEGSSTGVQIEAARRLFDTAGYNANVSIQRRAFADAGMLNGNYKISLDGYSLNNVDAPFTATEPYMTKFLHLVGRDGELTEYRYDDLQLLDRVGIENRFANTDQLRQAHIVSWSRVASVDDLFRQLSDGRVDAVILDHVIATEFNKLLEKQNKPRLFISKEPIFSVDVSMIVGPTLDDKQQFIDAMNRAIADSGKTRYTVVPSESPPLLSMSKYEALIRRW